MKTFHIFSVKAAALIGLLLLISCQQNEGQKALEGPDGITPPAPEEPSVDMRYPSAPDVKPVQSLQGSAHRFAYQLQVDERAIEGSFSGSARVSSRKRGEVSLAFEDGRSGRLLYVFPEENVQLTLSDDQTVRIQYVQEYVGSAQNRAFALATDRSLQVAALRLSGDTPIERNFFDLIQIRQEAYSQKDVKLRSDTDIHYAVPLVIQAGRAQRLVYPGESPFTFNVGDAAYELHVLANGFVEQVGGEDVAFEGPAGYYLDCWVHQVK